MLIRRQEMPYSHALVATVGIPMGEELGWNGLGAGYGLMTWTVLVLLLRRKFRVTRATTTTPSRET